MKTYIAQADTGRDFIEFVFYSEHRANSKANIEDAQKCYKKFHGHRLYQIKRTILANDIIALEGDAI